MSGKIYAFKCDPIMGDQFTLEELERELAGRLKGLYTMEDFFIINEDCSCG